jgi:CrcB protein
MDLILFIGLGGAIGAVMRYLLSGWVQQASGSISFPLGTLAVNVTGCFVIGVLSQLGESRGLLTPRSRAFLVVGILGGFTTFSSFANESMNLLRGDENVLAALNVGGSVALGLMAVWLGRSAAYLIWR